MSKAEDVGDVQTEQRKASPMHYTSMVKGNRILTTLITERSLGSIIHDVK
jgi:hypothetical protein